MLKKFLRFTFDNLNNFVHKNSAKNNPVEADDGIKTASGWDVGDHTYAYPEQLGRLLSDTCTVGNFGRGSSCVYYHTGRNKSLWYPNTPQYDSSNEFDADIVVIKLGTNDTGYAAIAEYVKDNISIDIFF